MSETPRSPSSSASPAAWSEDRLNAPSRQTVGMLTIVAATTLISWGAGRAACNYHEPGESLSPKEVSLEARTRNEKDVAFELAQRWAAADFATAKQLVAGELAASLEKDEKACRGGACDERRKASDDIHSVAEVLQRNAQDAFVRVRTVGAPGGEVTRIYEIERIDSRWKATRQLSAEAPLPPLKEPAPSALRPPKPGAPGTPTSPTAPSSPQVASPKGAGPAVPLAGPTAAGPTAAGPSTVRPPAQPAPAEPSAP